MPAGRPTKYKDEYATTEFLAGFLKHCKHTGELVSLCGLACYCEVCEDTIQEWQKVHPEFSVSLSKIKQLSKQMLINKGLDSTYNSTIAKLILSSNHGMVEKRDLNLTGDLIVKTVNYGEENRDNPTT